MTAAFRSAFILILAGIAFASNEAELNRLAPYRHKVLSPLGDLKLSTSEAEHKIAEYINNLLLVPHASTTFWQDLMSVSAGSFPWAQGEEGLNEAKSISRLNEFVDHQFPAADSVQGASDSEVLANYFANLPAIYQELEHVMKAELVNQFLKAVKEGSSIQFYETIPASVQTSIFSKANALIDARRLQPKQYTDQVIQTIQNIQKSIKSVYFNQIVELANLYTNAIEYLGAEVKAVILAGADDRSVTEEAVIAKYDYVLYLLTELNKEDKSNPTTYALFDTLKNFIVGNRIGSQSVAIRVRKMVPQIVGTYVRHVGTAFGHDVGYDFSRKYFEILGNKLVNPKVDAWFARFGEGDLPNADNADAEDFAERAMIICDINMYVPFKYDNSDGESQSLLMWWMAVQRNIVDVYEAVSAENIVGTMNIKLVFAQSELTSEAGRDFSNLLYKLIVRWYVNNDGSVITEANWNVKFLNWLGEHLADLGEQKHFYLPMVSLVMFVRNNDEGVVHIGDYARDALTKKALGAWLVSQKAAIPKIMLGYRSYIVEDLKKTVKKADLESGDLGDLIVGKDIPAAKFKKMVTSTSTETQLVNEVTQGGNLKKIDVGIKEGRGADNLNEIQRLQSIKKLEEAPVVVKEKTPVKQQEELPVVVKEKTPVKTPIKEEEQPVILKEKTPVKTPVKDIEEPIVEREKTPVKTPIKENLNVDEQSPKNKIQPVQDNIDSNPIVQNEPILTPKKTPAKEVEEENILPIGSPVHISNSPFKTPRVQPELDNLVEVVKGELDPVTVEALRKNPDLIDLVEKIQIVVDPETGDETHYHYIQVVPKDSACYQSITE